jgi:hypothetical protein
MNRHRRDRDPDRPNQTLADLRRAEALAQETRTLIREAGALRSYLTARRLVALIGGAIRHAERLQARGDTQL